jgi:hypothetical protein
MSSAEQDGAGSGGSATAADAAPDLGELLQRLSGADKPADKPAPAAASADKPAPGPEPAPAAAAAEPDAEAKTSEYRQVEAPPGATAMYNPSVSKLVKRLEPQDVAPAVNPLLGKARVLAKHLNDVREDVRKHRSPTDALRPRLVSAAEQSLEEANTLAASISPDDQELADEKRQLNEAGMRLRNLIDGLEPPPPPPEPPKPEPQQQPATGVALPLGESTSRWSRGLTRLIIILVLLSGIRVYLLVTDRRSPVVKHTTEAGRVTTENSAAAATEDALSRGTPSVLQVHVSIEPDGSLRARALVLDPNGDRTKLTFKWFEDGAVKDVESNGVFPSPKRGAAYHVEVTASDGQTQSQPVVTQPLIAGLPPNAGGNGP